MMKPFKIIHKAEIFDKGRWQYKSNIDPFSKSEPPQWEFYSLEHNYLIEKAYYDQQKEVDIGDYIISMNHMIQKKKGAAVHQRPIRRVNWEGEIQEIDRSARYFETELPKTMNKVFGSLGDFVRFFSRRNPEILDFTTQFEEIEKSHNLIDLNQKIAPKLVSCLGEQLLKPILEQLQDSSLPRLKKKVLLETKERHEELILLFNKESQSFEEFYGEILRAYTMNTSLYETLNRYLRNESWIEIDNLLPYVYCLCKAFFHLRLKNNGVILEEVKSIILYRGTALDEHSLSFYNNSQTVQQHFSWNSVTSSTTNFEVAKDFMYKSVDMKNKKYPVMFIIEIPITQEKESEYLKWIDVHQYSAMPKEDEIILAPGSVFEFMEASTDKDKRTIIRLKLKIEIQALAHGGLIMHGALQKKLMTDKEAKIVCLEGEELHDALKCLAGNKLIEEVEFCLCTFDNCSLRLMINILSTLEKIKELKFKSCEYKDEKQLKSEREENFTNWKRLKVEIFGITDFYKVFMTKNAYKSNWVTLCEFHVNFGDTWKHKFVEVNSQSLQILRSMTQLTSLTLPFSWSDITDKEVQSLASQGLRYLTQLTSLTLSFSCNEKLTDEGVRNLACQGLRYLNKLTLLNLDFTLCSKITDKGVRILASEGLQHLSNLVSLKLAFYERKILTDEGLHSLASQGLRYLTQLTSLTLSYTICSQITDKGLQSLAFQGLRHLTQLTSLTLAFEACSLITDKGAKILASQGLRYLTQLTSFTLSFSCKFTEKGVHSLASQGLQNLKKLTSLTLSMSIWGGLDKGIKSLGTQGFQYLKKLTSLNLEISSSGEIFEKGAHFLASQGLQYLTQLRSLTLNFIWSEITDKSVHILASEGLQPLTQLVSLSLKFRNCSMITDKGVHSLAAEGLRFLTQLKFLGLEFCWHDEAKGSNLISQVQRYIPQFALVHQSGQELQFESSSHVLSQRTFNCFPAKILCHRKIFQLK